MLSNITIRTQPDISLTDRSTPSYGLYLLCDLAPKWIPIAVYPTKSPNSFLQIRLYDTDFNLCSRSKCSTKVIIFNYFMVFKPILFKSI